MNDFSLANIAVCRFDQLSRQTAITHFVTTRNDGDLAHPYASFNICHYTGDDPTSVADCRNRLSQALAIKPFQIIVPRQVHGDRIGVVGETKLLEESGFEEEVDALITNKRGICLTVSTADCVPVLLYCPARQVIAVVHAGWRGMVKRIVSKTVARMVAQFGCNPAHIQAAIGPSISPEAFEVGAEVAEAFEQAGFASVILPSPIEGKAYIDLWQAATADLLSVGLANAHIEVAGICTVANASRFFSARRLGIRSGRISSGIMLVG